MESQFGPDQVRDFLKLLIETGGVHFVDMDGRINHSEDGTPVGVRVGEGKNNKKCIALYTEGKRPPQNSVYLNPFVELIGSHPELDMFIRIFSVVPGCLVLKTMEGIAKLFTDKNKDADFKLSKKLSKFAGRVDEKFIKELEKVRAIDTGVIAYDTQKYTAQLQCVFWTDKWLEDNKSKFRKGSIALIKEMAETIYGTKTPHTNVYTGTLPPCKRFDAIAHVFVESLAMIKDIVEPILDIDLHVDELKAHLEHLPAYHKAMQWLATSTTSPTKTTTPAPVKSPDAPWDTSVANVAPVSLATAPGLGSVAPVSPISHSVANPTWGGAGGQVVANPTFGGGASSAMIGGGSPFHGSMSAAPGLSSVVAVSPPPESPFRAAYGMRGGW